MNRAAVQPGVDAGELYAEQAVTGQAPLLRRVKDSNPGRIHQFMDRRL